MISVWVAPLLSIRSKRLHAKMKDITLAFAGLMQAVALVREVTQTGKIVNEAAFASSVYSIFQTDPTDSASVYGGAAGVKLGLEKLLAAFTSNKPLDRSQSRYIMSLIHLQKKVSRSPRMLDLLAERISQTKKQVDYFSLLHPAVISNLADTYLNTISTFKLRIILLGTHRILDANENMNKIRTLLLAGIRSAFLWRQSGGSRLQLIFSRDKMQRTARDLLANMHEGFIPGI